MNAQQISDHDFNSFQRFIYQESGISLGDGKKQLVVSRLSKRLKLYQLADFGEYFELIDKESNQEEKQIAIDLLTTNETYFFREAKHFEFLAEQAGSLYGQQEKLRVWSAASSTGQEAYSIAMVLSQCLGNRNWEVVASDISSQVLESARLGVYPIDQAQRIPQDYLQRYCLKGVGCQSGNMLIQRNLKEKVTFERINLNQKLPSIGNFDVIFLRNVLIYFDLETKKRVIERLVERLSPGGFLIIGHSESLNGITNKLTLVQPTIYQNSRWPTC